MNRLSVEGKKSVVRRKSVEGMNADMLIDEVKVLIWGNDEWIRIEYKSWEDRFSWLKCWRVWRSKYEVSFVKEDLKGKIE